MPAAVAIPLIIGAAETGVQVATAVHASNAAQGAAATQVAASNRALAVAQQNQAANVQRQAPYVAAGTNAVNNLSKFVNTPGAAASAPPPANPNPPSPFAATTNGGQTPPMGAMPSATPPPQGSGPFGSLAATQPGQPPPSPFGAMGQQPPSSGQLGPSGATPGMIRMQGPDGSVRLVPQASVPQYQAQGAKVLQ